MRPVRSSQPFDHYTKYGITNLSPQAGFEGAVWEAATSYDPGMTELLVAIITSNPVSEVESI